MGNERVNETVIKITIPAWGIVEETGYKPCTTLWQDFSIADKFGLQAVKGTFHKSFPWAKKGYKEVTELCLVLNHKIWQHYESNMPLARLYNELWEKVDAWCGNNLKGEELDYFYETTD